MHHLSRLSKLVLSVGVLMLVLGGVALAKKEETKQEGRSTQRTLTNAEVTRLFIEAAGEHSPRRLNQFLNNKQIFNPFTGGPTIKVVTSSSQRVTRGTVELLCPRNLTVGRGTLIGGLYRLRASSAIRDEFGTEIADLYEGGVDVANLNANNPGRIPTAFAAGISPGVLRLLPRKLRNNLKLQVAIACEVQTG